MMAPPLLSAYLTMLPRLQAEEALLAAQVASLPYAKRREGQRIARRWSEVAAQKGAAGERRRPAQSARQIVAMAVAAGIPVVREKGRG